MTSTERGRRLPPKERKVMLLEQASTFIREHGLAPLTMEALAQFAGVSKPLVYNYFKNRLALLKEVLVNEVEHRQEIDLEVARTAKSLDDLIEKSAWAMLRHIEDRGNIIQQLMLEPEVASSMRKMRSTAKPDYVSFLSNQMTKEMGVSPTTAPVITEVLLGMGTTAGTLFERDKRRIEEVHEVLVTLTRGALDAAVRRYS